jgi:hypothetical protein
MIETKQSASIAPVTTAQNPRRLTPVASHFSRHPELAPESECPDLRLTGSKARAVGDAATLRSCTEAKLEHNVTVVKR